MITVTILTKNAERTLFSTLKGLAAFDRVLLLDTGSTDTTLHIAKGFSNTTIHETPFLGFGNLHNLAASLAKTDWILSIDSDEVMSDQLSCEILSLSLDPQFVYALPRYNYFNGKRMKCCGWHPDIPVRLYSKKMTSFSQDAVHEKVLSKNLTTMTLNHPLYHYSYHSISDLLRKMELYTTLFAEQNGKKQKASLSTALSHSLYTFCKSYFFQRGITHGKEGMILSLYKAHTALYKYLKLWEQNALEKKEKVSTIESISNEVDRTNSI